MLKVHIALKVDDLLKAVEFYQILFGVSPVKHKLGYAKFDVDVPALNLTLNQRSSLQSHSPEVNRTLSHLGIQVESVEEIKEAIARFKVANFNIREEGNTNCCYALQDKVWITDPDGNPWEIFVVNVADTAPEFTWRDNAEAIHMPASQAASQAASRGRFPSCCA